MLGVAPLPDQLTLLARFRAEFEIFVVGDGVSIAEAGHGGSLVPVLLAGGEARRRRRVGVDVARQGRRAEQLLLLFGIVVETRSERIKPGLGVSRPGFV